VVSVREYRVYDTGEGVAKVGAVAVGYRRVNKILAGGSKNGLESWLFWLLLLKVGYASLNK
jgi:hypothetical protein